MTAIQGLLNQWINILRILNINKLELSPFLSTHTFQFKFLNIIHLKIVQGAQEQVVSF